MRGLEAEEQKEVFGDPVGARVRGPCGPVRGPLPPAPTQARASPPKLNTGRCGLVLGGSSWKHLDSSFGCRGRSLGGLLEAVSKPLGARFGACWGLFGGILGASRGSLGSLLGPLGERHGSILEVSRGPVEGMFWDSWGASQGPGPLEASWSL